MSCELGEWIKEKVDAEKERAQVDFIRASSALDVAFREYWAPSLRSKRYYSDSHRENEVHVAAIRRAEHRARLRMLTRASEQTAGVCGWELG